MRFCWVCSPFWTKIQNGITSFFFLPVFPPGCWPEPHFLGCLELFYTFSRAPFPAVWLLIHHVAVHHASLKDHGSFFPSQTFSYWICNKLSKIILYDLQISSYELMSQEPKSHWIGWRDGRIFGGHQVSRRSSRKTLFSRIPQDYSIIVPRKLKKGQYAEQHSISPALALS